MVESTWARLRSRRKGPFEIGKLVRRAPSQGRLPIQRGARAAGQTDARQSAYPAVAPALRTHFVVSDPLQLTSVVRPWALTRRQGAQWPWLHLLSLGPANFARILRPESTIAGSSARPDPIDVARTAPDGFLRI